MTTSDTGMRLIRRVPGGRGSVRLYEHRDGLAEVVEVTDDGTQIIELQRHGPEMRHQLLQYLDDVQSAVAKRKAGGDT